MLNGSPLNLELIGELSLRMILYIVYRWTWTHLCPGGHHGGEYLLTDSWLGNFHFDPTCQQATCILFLSSKLYHRVAIARFRIDISDRVLQFTFHIVNTQLHQVIPLIGSHMFKTIYKLFTNSLQTVFEPVLFILPDRSNIN